MFALLCCMITADNIIAFYAKYSLKTLCAIYCFRVDKVDLGALRKCQTCNCRTRVTSRKRKLFSHCTITQKV